MPDTRKIYPELLNQLPALAACWRSGELDAAMFASLYLLLWQIAMHGPQFASRKRKCDPRPEVEQWLNLLMAPRAAGLRQRLLDFFGRYQFRGVIGNVPAALQRWLRGEWPLIACQDIPSPRELLAWQARGVRAVAIKTDSARVHEPLLNKRNAYEFFLHDLEHAYKFFHSPELHAGQRAFFLKLETALDGGMFAMHLSDDAFREKFHYLMGDMNTHPEHSRQYLRAILIEFYLRRDGRELTAALSPAMERNIEEILRAVTVSAMAEWSPSFAPQQRDDKTGYAEARRGL